MIAENRLGYDAGDLDDLGALADLATSVFMVTGSPTESADTTASIADTTVDVAGGVEVLATDSMD